MNIRLLKSKMVLADDNVTTLAEYLGQSAGNLFKKLNGSTAFSLQDVSAIRERYNLSNAEVYEIFIKRGDESEQVDGEGSCEQA